MTKLIGSHLGPMFAEQKLGAEIFLGSLSEDDHGGRSQAIIDAVTSDPNGMSYVKGFGFEWQGLDLVAAVRAKKSAHLARQPQRRQFTLGLGVQRVDCAERPRLRGHELGLHS